MGDDLTIGLLGPVEARRAEGTIAVAGSKLQALLALLALAVPHAVSDDRLIEEIWGDDAPMNPVNSLQAQVSQLRRLLGREVVVRQGAGYRLAVAADAVDAHRLDIAVERARVATAAGDHRAATQHLRAALALRRGPVLADLQDLDVARQAASRIEEQLLAGHEALVDLELAAGRHAEVVAGLIDLVRSHPLRERFAAQLVTALYRCGRQIDALQAYGRVREALVEEFGVEPGPELQALERAVLDHDPALAATASTRASGSGRGPSHPPRSGRLPLVGRDAEVEDLAADLTDALAGRGRVDLLVGEPGIGKTRLAEEVADDGRARGATVGWGRSHDAGGEVPFRPWAQMVEALLGQVPPDEVVAALGRTADVVAQVVSAVADRLPDLAPPPPLDTAGAQARACDALTRLLRTLARSRPLVLVLDDVQWADRASLQMLGHLSRELADARILLVVTYRSVGAPADGGLAQALDVIGRQPIVRRVELDGLDHDDLAALVAARGAALDDALLATVHRRTQGNPFFATEVLRLLGDGSASPDGDVVVPSGVRDVVRQRLLGLPSETHDTLAAAAVAGSHLELSVLSRAVGLDVVTVLERLEPALAEGILLASADLATLRFSHGLVAETVVGDLPAVRRARLHQATAAALEAQHGSDGPHLPDVAAHWARAVPVAPIDVAVRSALRSARWTTAHLAVDGAEDQLRTALALVEGLPAGPERDALELAVSDALAVLLIVARGFGSPDVAGALDRMQDLASSVEDRDVVTPVLMRLVNYRLAACRHAEAGALGERLLALGAPDGHPGATTSGHLALGAVAANQGDITRSSHHYDLALAGLSDAVGWRAIGLEAPGEWTAVYACLNQWLRGDPDDAEARAIAGVTGFRRTGDLSTEVIATWLAALIAVLRQEPAVARERAEGGLDLAAAHGISGLFVLGLKVCRGWARARQGEADGEEELTATAASLAASGVSMLGGLFAALHADICLAAGRAAEAQRVAEAGLAVVERTGERWFEPELHRLRGVALAGIAGCEDDALAAMRQAIAVAGSQGSLAFGLRAESTLAELGAGQGSVQRTIS